MSYLSDILLSGDGKPITVQEIIQKHKDIASTLTPARGRISRLSEEDYSLDIRFNAVDCDLLQSVSRTKIYSLNRKTMTSHCVSDTIEELEGNLAVSDNGRYQARVKNRTDDKKAENQKKQILEIWDKDKLLKSIEVSDLYQHGPICTDEQFCKLLWSKKGQQDKLLYICQNKPPKRNSYFNLDDQIPLGSEFLKQEDWGECLTGIHHTVMAVLDLANDFHITVIDIDGFSFADPQWIDDDTKIVSVAYQEQPKKLGLVWCNNRPTKLMVHEWRTCEFKFEIYSGVESFHSPRANNAGDKFLFASNHTYGSHRRCEALNICDIRTTATKRFVHDVFISSLPECPFTHDDVYVLFVRREQLKEQMVLYNFGSRRKIIINFPTTEATILDFKNDLILASGSDVDRKPTLFVSSIGYKDPNITWTPIYYGEQLNDIKFETFQMENEEKTSFISCILINPILPHSLLPEDLFPTVVAIHGGPNDNYFMRYYAQFIFLARLGLKILLINYRGSTGVNDSYMNILSGQIGKVDVGDCLLVIKTMIQRKLINPKRLILHGGSHGGFVAAHLSCNKELRILCTILINPVTDLSTLWATSDIPDWSFNNSLGHQRYHADWLPSSKEVGKMFEVSPMSRHLEASVPTLLLLGSEDRRVPMFQGERWAEAIKARGVEVLCKVYPDQHRLTKPAHDCDSQMTKAIWILSHLTRSEEHT